MTPEYERAWLSDDSNLRKLSNLFNDPTFQSAIGILRGRGRPAIKLLTAPADSALTHNALENARITGYHQALDQLINLVNKPTQTENQPEPKPFMDQAIEDLKQRGLTPKNL